MRLSDFEYRVWTQYILSADDFGVMRAAATKLQSDNGYLDDKPRPRVQAALDRVITIGLLKTFEHQGVRYVFQHDWQKWQKVEWPRATNEPKPPQDALDQCDELTVELFAKHPGGQRRLRGGSGSGGDVQASTPVHAPVHIPSGSGDVQDAHAVRVPTTRAGARAERLRLTANGQRPTAVFGEGAETPLPPLDLWLRELQDVYPPQSVTFGFLTQSAFHEVIATDGRPYRAVFDEMLANLDNQKAGYQWRVKRMVPNLDKWLREGRWKQRHEAAPPTALISERTLQTDLAGEAFVRGGQREH
jgi:hypothetical protein